MTVRDLGYRAYEGELLPASHNTWVLLRYGMWRIWGAWINKLVVFVALLPALALIGLAFVRFLMFRGTLPPSSPDAPDWFRWFASPDAALWVRSLTSIQVWFFVTVMTLRSGAGVVAEDFTHKAYQFYFAKPVTPVQYLLGRAAALAIFVFGLVFVPALLLILALSGFGAEDRVLETIGLVLPALLDAAIIAISCSVLAVAVSALSKSRALTFTAWVVLFVVPFILGMLVDGITDHEWAYAISLPALLSVIGDALYKVHDEWAQLAWYHAAPVLALVTAGGGYLALRRIRQAEVIT
jgi:hypothetical protein